MRLLHSADWQIGARFRQFGARAARLREARVRTLERVLELAAERQVDALLIAGDLFEDHGIEPAAVGEVHGLLAAFAKVPIFIAPGNHDPVGSATAIWARAPFAAPLPHVTIFREAAAVPLAGGWLIANPLTQKRSALDPTLRLAELARALPAGTIKVGLTHGSPAITGKHQPDDFPIAVDAATRAGLDFLALGHWHSALSLDGGRILMPGTPEPASFGEEGSGQVHEIELERPGVPPKITPLPCARLCWREVEALAEDWERLRSEVESWPPETVVRITLRGLLAPHLASRWRAEVQGITDRCTASEVRDETRPDFAPNELAELQRVHPLLTQVLSDLEALGAADGAFARSDVETLEKRVGCGPGELRGPLLESARGVLMRELREATAC